MKGSEVMFKDKVVAITGAAQGIGRRCAESFEREGATVHVIDIRPGPRRSKKPWIFR